GRRGRGAARAGRGNRARDHPGRCARGARRLRHAVGIPDDPGGALGRPGRVPAAAQRRRGGADPLHPAGRFRRAAAAAEDPAVRPAGAAASAARPDGQRPHGGDHLPVLPGLPARPGHQGGPLRAAGVRLEVAAPGPLLCFRHGNPRVSGMETHEPISRDEASAALAAAESSRTLVAWASWPTWYWLATGAGLGAASAAILLPNGWELPAGVVLVALLFAVGRTA